MTSQVDLVAIADADPNTAGAIVWWKLREHSDMCRLESAWAAANLDPTLLPSRPTPLAALKRAMRELVQFRRLVRPLEHKNGYAIVDETAQQDDLSYRVQCTAKVLADDTIAIDPPNFRQARTLRETYDVKSRQLARHTIGSWLAGLADKCSGVTLRESGGIYFIPRGQTERFRAMTSAFMQASENVVFEVPALKSSEAVNAILDAVNTESGSALEEIQNEIATGELGAAALRTREKRCDRILAKLEAYADLLGNKLDAIKERIDDTKAGVVEAALLAEADDIAE